MSLRLRAGALGTLACLTFGTADLRAQAAPVGAPPPAAAGSAADTTDTVVKKKKGGLIGAAKKVAGNKVVKEVTKVAACTMVPGGQAVAGAIDAASAKSAGEAAQGAAGAATGSSCMPGMGGAGMANAAAAEAATSSATPSGPSQGMMPYGAGGPPGYSGGQSMAAQTEASDRAMAQCLGLSVEDYQAMARPAGYEPRAPTNDEMKRAGKISKKVGAQRQAQCSQQVGMQQASSQMAAMQQMMAGAQPGGMPSGPPAGPSTPRGRGVELDPDPAAALAAGKTTIRNIVWLGNNPDPAHADAFDEAMVALAQSLKGIDGKLKITVYSNEKFGSKDHDAYMRGLRGEAVADALTSDGIIPTSRVVVDKKGDYGDDRVEISRAN